MPDMQPKNLFTVLGLAPNVVLQASDAEVVKLIEAQYRAISQFHHPDKGGSAEKFAELSGAYDALKDSSELREIVRADLRRTMAIHEEMANLKWQLNDWRNIETGVRAGLAEIIQGSLNSAAPAFISLRGVTYGLWNSIRAMTVEGYIPDESDDQKLERAKKGKGQVEGREEESSELDQVAPLNRNVPEATNALSRRVRALARKTGDIYGAQMDAPKRPYGRTVEVRDDGVVVVKEKEGAPQIYRNKVVIGSTSLFELATAFERDRKTYASVVDREYSKKRSIQDYGLSHLRPRLEGVAARLEAANPEKIPLSFLPDLLNFMRLSVEIESYDHHLVTLNFPASEAPFLRLEGRLDYARLRVGSGIKELVNRPKLHKPEVDGSSDV
jgi:curved DNA-binding protein CbpA